MNKKCILWLIAIFFIFLNLNFIFAMMLELFEAVNHDEKLCGLFDGSLDNYENWERLQGKLVRYNAIVKTPFGDCNFVVTPDDSPDSNYLTLSEYYPKCCEKLGFTYIDNNLISYNKEGTINVDGRFFNCIFSTLDSSIIINTKTNQCSKGGDFYFYNIMDNTVRYGGGSRETKDYCKFEDSNWINYSSLNYAIDKQEIYGVLYNNRDNISSVECSYYEINDRNCCNKMGYKYIGGVDLTIYKTLDNEIYESKTPDVNTYKNEKDPPVFLNLLNNIKFNILFIVIITIAGIIIFIKLKKFKK